MGILLFFIDGLGIGEKNKNNALHQYGLWNHIFGYQGITSHKKLLKKNYTIIPTDAALNVEGIPQSATGQTSLFTGLNAQKIIGGHITGLPGEKLTALLLENSILKVLKERGNTVTSANAYSHQYFQLVREQKKRVSASTLAIQAANVPFRMLEDLENNKAVFMDVNHKILKTRHPQFSTRSLRQSAKNLADIVKTHDFTLFEYFWTDFVGHKGSMKDKKEVLTVLNGFLKALIAQLDLRKNIIIISSDHGNIEDHKKRKHTENKVPTIVITKNKGYLNLFYHKVENIMHISECILKILDNKKV